MKLIALILIAVASCCAQSLPDAPSAVAKHPDRFWSFRGVYRDANNRRQFNENAPLLHPNKRSYVIFFASHAVLIAAYASCNHKIEEPHSEVPAIAVVSALDYLAFRAFSPAMGWEGSAFAAQHYFRARH